MGIIIYLILGIVAEFIIKHYLVKRTATALSNDPGIVFHLDNEKTDEHLSISSVDVDENDEIVIKTAKAEISGCISKNYKWWYILTNLIVLCIWPISMTLILLIFDKCITDEDIVNDLLSDN